MSAITVGVRVRPFNSREVKYNAANIVAMEQDTQTIKLAVVRQGKVVDEKPKEFQFDHLFWTHDGAPGDGKYACQDTVYRHLGKPVVDNVCEGYNSCLFAYGQTGSGKTYSMLGYGSDTGIIPKACEDLFARTTSLGAVAVECSYLEIYNEIVKDLLAEQQPVDPNVGLKIRQHPKTGVFVEGLRKVAVHTPAAILHLLDEGNKVRAVAATNMNATSSRSHAVLIITVSQVADSGAAGATVGKVGRMSLVDLAGSERATSTGATGDTLVEGASINKSLSVLGMCLARLADKADKADSAKGGHVPYRDSSLTFLLSESLGGNSRTSMLAAISPADVNFDETLSTLRFAQVTKKVKNVAVVNENPTARLIRELKEELAMLKAQLRGYEATAPPPTVDRPLSADASPPGEDQVATEAQVAAAPEGGEDEVDGERNTTAASAGEAADADAATKENNEEAGEESGDAVPAAGAAVDAAELMRRIQEGEAAERALEALAQEYVAPPADEDEQGGGGASGGGALGAASSGPSASVFVDWCKPQLVNICPESSTLVLHVREGANFYVLEDAADPSAPIQHRAKAPAADERQHAFAVYFDPLRNSCSITVEPTPPDAAPFINGQQVQFPLGSGGGAPSTYTARLAHGDRLIVGKVALRFAHSSALGTARDFSAIPRDVEHLEELERFHRYSRIERPFFSKLRVWFQQFKALVANKDDDDDDDASAAAALFLRGIDSVTTLLKALEQKAEERLVANYPVTSEELLAHSRREVLRMKRRLSTRGAATNPLRDADGSASPAAADALDAAASSSSDDDDESAAGVGGGSDAGAAAGRDAIFGESLAQQYDAAIAEQRESVRRKDALIARLRHDIERATSDRRQREMSVVRRKTEQEDLERRQEADIARQLEEELAWHAAVKKARKFSATGPPRDRPADVGMYERVTAASGNEMPYLQELIEVQAEALGRPRVGSIIDSAESLSSTGGSSGGGGGKLRPVQCGTIFKMSQNRDKKWEQRYAIIVKNFLHYFRVCDGRQRALGSIYLYGATVAEVSEKTNLGRPHVVLLTAAVPRRPGDTNSFYLSFASAGDRELWCRWISLVSVPPLPQSMFERMEAECAAALATKQPLPTQWRWLYTPPSDSAVALRDDPTVAAATTAGKDSRSHWKPDDAVLACERCQVVFTFFTRRHHCRGCGAVACSSCVPKREARFNGVMKSKRICGNCFALQQKPGVSLTEHGHEV